MSSTSPGPRPREVTIGGFATAAASAVLVVAVFDRMAGLRSVATRDALTKALTSGWAEGLGITVDDAITLIRVALFVAGAAAAITGILGIFVLQRHARARLALTVAAVPVVLTAPVVGGLLGIIIGVSTGLLWTRPARDWFAGRPATPRERPRPSIGPVPKASEPPGEGSVGWRPPVLQGPLPPNEAAPQPGPPAYPAAYPAQYPAQYPAPYPAPDPPWTYAQPSPRQHTAPTSKMPVQARIACILTWIFSLLTGGVYLVLILVVAVDRGEVIDLLRDNSSIQDASLTDSQLIGIVVAMSAVVLVWCLAASLLALFTWRRHAWAWIMLLVSVGFAGLFELLALPFSLLHLAACVTSFVLLLRAPVRAWIRGDTGPRPPASWPGKPPGNPSNQPPGWPQPVWAPPTVQQPPPEQQPGPYPQPPPEQPPGKPPVW